MAHRTGVHPSMSLPFSAGMHLDVPKVNKFVFSLPKDAFRGSPLSSPFVEIASIPPGHIDTIEGGTEERAIILRNVSETEFDSFMRVVYPLCVFLWSKMSSKWML